MARLTLCNSVGQPTNLLYVLVPNAFLIQGLERLLCNFFREGQRGSELNHLVKWHHDGGLGIGNLKSRNTALLFKWSWRFLKEQDSLWCKILKSIHAVDPHLWCSLGKLGLSLTSPWISISSCKV